MALSFPADEQWNQHDRFIDSVKVAAVPTKPKQQLSISSMLDAMRRTNLRGESLLSRGGPHPEPSTLAEMFRPDPPPFECAEMLPTERGERIVMLREWLGRLPAQHWLEQQQPVRDALESLQRVRKRSDCPVALGDDLAEFRFWRFASHLARASNARRFSDDMPNPPDADQRKRAADAAAEIIRIAEATSLLMSAHVDWKHREGLLAGLRAIHAHQSTPRRRRMDAHQKERDFIQSATYLAEHYMGAASTAVVAALVRLFVKKKVDDSELEKLIRAEKKRWAAVARG